MANRLWIVGLLGVAPLACAQAVQTKSPDMELVSRGYADVNGLKLYHEAYGHGEPLVLIPGGLTTIREMQGWVGVAPQFLQKRTQA